MQTMTTAAELAGDACSAFEREVYRLVYEKLVERLEELAEEES